MKIEIETTVKYINKLKNKMYSEFKENYNNTEN